VPCEYSAQNLADRSHRHADVDPKPSSPMASVYDLIANIPHETTSASTNAGSQGLSTKKNDRDEGDTVWKVHVRAGAGGAEAEKWFALQDLDVTEVRKEMVFLGETVVQVSCFETS
jgi:U4/U6.U5 tri-snRNP-associated protein 2